MFSPGVEMHVDVFEQHRAFIHEHADGERQSTQGHDVDGLSREPEQHHRRQQRERNRDDDDERTIASRAETAAASAR